MRVLLAADFYPPTPGGLEAHVRRLGHALHARGHRVVVVSAGREPSGPGADPYPVLSAATMLGAVPGLHRSASRPFPPPWADRLLVRRLTEVMDDFAPDVVHAHGWIAASCEEAARRRGAPVVVTLHDYGALCPLKTLLSDGRPCRHTAGLACVRCPGSDQGTVKRLALAGVLARRDRPRGVTYAAVSSAVAERHGASARPLDAVVIPNFLDPLTVAPSVVRPDGTVLFVGPDQPYKGIGVVEAAHRMLSRRGHDVVLHHVGGSTVRADEPGIRRSGVLSGDALGDAYRDASVVVIAPLWEEPCPTVALEAMAAGRPIVAAAIGGLTDLVDDGVTGLLVPPGDPGALADGIGQVLADPCRLGAMGRAAAERARQFSTDAVVPRIVALYERAVGSGPRGSAPR